MYRVLIKYCVFPSKFGLYTDTEGKPRNTDGLRNLEYILKLSKKHNILCAAPCVKSARPKNNLFVVKDGLKPVLSTLFFTFMSCVVKLLFEMNIKT